MLNTTMHNMHKAMQQAKVQPAKTLCCLQPYTSSKYLPGSPLV
jgi:hypothetical protein